MLQSCPTISPSPSPASPFDPVWDEAFLRVESYLRAHHVESRVLLNRLSMEIIQEARLQTADRPDLSKMAVAMQITHVRIGEWFSRAWKEGDWANERDRARGRLALVIAVLPGRWANHFLSKEPIPIELTETMSSFTLQSGPELRFSNMPPAPLEFGFDSGDPDRLKASRWMLLRTAASWWVVIGLFGVAWAASH